VSSLGTAYSGGTVYQSKATSERGDKHRHAITVSTAIAGILTMLGAASILAGLTGVFDIEPLGLVRTAFYLGLGLAGAGSGGLLLIVLADLRKAYDAGSPGPDR
jgi:hypothetical protein